MARPEPTTPEVDRLVQAYEQYDADPANRARWSEDNAGNRAIHAERAARIARLLGGGADGQARGGGAGRRDLASSVPLVEVGCGSGQVLADLPPGLAGCSPVVGIDLSAARLALAAPRLPEATFVRAEGSTLPFPTACVGAVLTCTLFSSILDDRLARSLAREIDRVLVPGGVVVWYDLRRRNPANPDVRPLGRSDVQDLFPGWSVDVRPITVLPPLVRRLGPATDRLYPLLARVRPLTTHLLGALTKPA